MDCSLTNRVNQPHFSDYPSMSQTQEGTTDRLAESLNNASSYRERILQSTWGSQPDDFTGSLARDENLNNFSSTETSLGKALPTPSPGEKARATAHWSEADDRFLDENKKTMSVKSMALKLGRSEGSIRSRQKQQTDPTHSAYKNLYGSVSGESKRVKIHPNAAAGFGTQSAIRSLLEERDRVLKEGDARAGSKAGSSSSRRVIPSTQSDSNYVQRAAADNPEPISLSLNQYEVIKLVLEGKSVFFSGSAGTGKSHVIKVLKEVFERLGMTDKVAYTAPTGIAACNISGVTVHSWGGIGILDPKKELHKIISKIRGSKESIRRWKTTKLLVIDEISMLSGELFDALSTIGQNIRSSDAPFGGIQLILCGDFFQLPPVGNSLSFAFESSTWHELFAGGQALGRQVVLDKVFRQKDPLFVRMLNELRRGEVSAVTARVLQAKVQQHQNSLINDSADEELLLDRVKPTVLYPTNKDVDTHNSRNLVLLSGELVSFKAVDSAKQDYLLKNLANMKAPPLLDLKIGAQVMLLKNLDTATGLVNGARGVVVKFEARDTGAGPAEHSSFKDLYFPVISFRVPASTGFEESQVLITEASFTIEQQGEAVATRVQLPLMLAWALSVHKAQGMTISNLQVSFSGMFEYGQAYVALSRATDLTGLRLVNFDTKTVKAHQRVKDFYTSLGYSEEKDMCDNDIMTTTVDDLVAVFHSGAKHKRQRHGDDDFASERSPVAASSWSKNDTWIDARRPALDPGMDDSFAPVRDAVKPKKAPVVTIKPPTHSFFNQFAYKERAPEVKAAHSAPTAAKTVDAFAGFAYDVDEDLSNGACLPFAPTAPVSTGSVMSEELRRKIQANKEAAQRKLLLRTQGL